jgi:hypothetical protein
MAINSGSISGSLAAKWKKIAEHEVLKRSSHSVASIADESSGGDEYELFVFGGELVARQPKDGDVHALRAGTCSFFNPPTEMNSI